MKDLEKQNPITDALKSITTLTFAIAILLLVAIYIIVMSYKHPDSTIATETESTTEEETSSEPDETAMSNVTQVNWYSEVEGLELFIGVDEYAFYPCIYDYYATSLKYDYIGTDVINYVYHDDKWWQRYELNDGTIIIEISRIDEENILLTYINYDTEESIISLTMHREVFADYLNKAKYDINIDDTVISE